MLAHAAMESFASENGARLTTMQSARDKLDQRLLELRALEGRLRQEQITGELLEIITGTETMRRPLRENHLCPRTSMGHDVA